MEQHELSLAEIKNEWHGSLKSYIIGFILSLLLTSISFLLVILRPEINLIFVITTLAILQAICQLFFFLHLGKEAFPRWESAVFYFMLFILVITVIGTLWIIFDLNDRMMPHD